MRRYFPRWFAPMLAAALVAIPGMGSATNGMNDIGIGAKSKGMGGVGIAYPQDAFAGAHNPAGMVYVGCRYDLGLGYVFQDSHLTSRTSATGVTPFTAKSDEGLWFPEVAFNWNYIPCQSLGFAAYIYGALDTSYQRPQPTGQTYQFYSVFLSPSWSWRFTCQHSLGVAINVAWNGLRVSGLTWNSPLLPNITARSLYPNYVTDHGTDWELGVGVRVGWLGKITRCLRVGATFQSKTWMGKFKKYQGLLVDNGNYDLPAEVGIGFSWDILPCLTLGFDFIDRLWSTSKTFHHNSRQLNGEFWGGGAATAFGSENGIGFGWKDQPIYKLGLAYRWCAWTFRIGYNHGDGPIGSATETALNMLTQAVVEDHITVGATWNTGCGELSAYYYHGFTKALRGRDSGGTIGPDPVNWDLKNQQNGVGVAYGACF